MKETIRKILAEIVHQEAQGVFLTTVLVDKAVAVELEDNCLATCHPSSKYGRKKADKLEVNLTFEGRKMAPNFRFPEDDTLRCTECSGNGQTVRWSHHWEECLSCNI